MLSKVISVSHFDILQSENVNHFFFKVFQLCDKQKQEDRVLIYILIFVGLGVLMLFTMFLQVRLPFINPLKFDQTFRVSSLPYPVKN